MFNGLLSISAKVDNCGDGESDEGVSEKSSFCLVKPVEMRPKRLDFIGLPTTQCTNRIDVSSTPGPSPANQDSSQPTDTHTQTHTVLGPSEWRVCLRPRQADKVDKQHNT
ncbi:unnamed protein product, partial [Protopolystoma xenopodis]